MIFVALNEAAERGELILVQDGLCRWHKRRDGVVVIREIIVLPFRRGTGVGRRLVREVCERNPGSRIVAKCPTIYVANAFWRAMGFRLIDEVDGVSIWSS